MTIDADQKPWYAGEPKVPPPEATEQIVSERLLSATNKLILAPAVDTKDTAVVLFVLPDDVELGSWDWDGGWWTVPTSGPATRIRLDSVKRPKTELFEESLLSPSLVLSETASADNSLKLDGIIVGAEPVLDWVYTRERQESDLLRAIAEIAEVIRSETGE